MSNAPRCPELARAAPTLVAALCLLVAAANPARAVACTPCNFSYSLRVEDIDPFNPVPGAPAQIITGSAQVFDSDLDLDLGPVQALLQGQAGPSAALLRVDRLTLGTVPGAAANDVLLARDGDVVLWVEAADSPAARLHASTEAALASPHAFHYAITAVGTDDPQVTFAFTLAATGSESYAKPAHSDLSISIAYYSNGETCEATDGDACLPFGCSRTKAALVELSEGGLLEKTLAADGDHCAKFHVKVTSTSGDLDCDGNLFFPPCWNCGAWYSGTVALDGTCPDDRPWARSVTGTGKARAPLPSSGSKPDACPPCFATTYAAAGGALGSGLPDAVGLSGPPPDYTAAIAQCKVGSVPVSCDAATQTAGFSGGVHVSMHGQTLQAFSDLAKTVRGELSGDSSLSASHGIVTLATFPFSAQNHDVRYTLTVTFQGRTYTDLNGDGTVDAGPFSLWLGGANGNELLGAFDRSSVPTAVIDSIAPNPAIIGQKVHFAGHGSPLATILRWEWTTNRPPGLLLGASPSFERSDLQSGKHQIKFRVFGHSWSAYALASLTVNQPPVAFINHVVNAVDPAHPAVALKLRDGVPSDRFHFDGSGVDFDGSVVAWQWTSSLDGVIGTQPVFDAALASLGTHTISLRVKDNLGAWSAPATTTVQVRRPPVLLVHGFCGGSDTWSGLVDGNLLGPQWLGNDIVRATFDPNGDGKTNDSPADVALLVAAKIHDMKSLYGVRTVDLVVHSMGGLASRAYIQGPAFQGDVNKLVMLGTPNHGANLADLILIGQGYSEADVELYLPVPFIVPLFRTLEVWVDALSALSLGPDLGCQREDSPAAHALRPHGDFVHNLNRNFKDEGTEDFGASNQPPDAISPYTGYFVVHGQGTAISHTHLPAFLKLLILAATAGVVDLTHMELATVRSGDTAVTERSLRLDGVPETGFDHTHSLLTSSADSVGQARTDLLDDPPPPPPGDPRLAQIEGAQVLGAASGGVLPSFAQDIEVDAAAARLRVDLSWEAAAAQLSLTPAEVKRGGGIGLVLVSPSGVTYNTSHPVPGFDVAPGSASLQATIANPAPGTWSVQVTGIGTAFAYDWLAHQESGTFLAIGLSADRTDLGKPVKLAAYVQSAGAGVTGAVVQAAVASPAGTTVSLPMVEDSRFPGLYAVDFTPPAEGVYKVIAAASLHAPQGGAPVTRTGMTTFEARSLAALSITATLSNPAPRHGEAVRWIATVRNAGAAAAPATAVQFFDGPPASGGRLLGSRTIDLPPAPAAVQASILWLATAGAHRLVAVVDPTNRTGDADPTRHVAELRVSAIDRTPPVARPGPDQVAAVGQNVVFDGRASTDDDRIVRYVWQFQGVRSFTLVGPYVVLAGGFPSPGDYTLQLTVTDASGNAGSAPLTVHVVEGTDTVAPVADAGPEMLAVVGEPVTFDGTRSRDNFGIARATWDVDVATDSDGDGDPADDQDLAGLSPTLERGYPRPGLYRARLTVRDAAGNGPSTADVLVRVVQPAGECTVTVPPGADVNHALALAMPGETVCLRPARYQTATIVISNPGVTLDGQGATLDGSALGEGGVGVLLATPADAAGATVRHLTVSGCIIGFFAATGAGHHLSDNAVQGCLTGFDVEAQQSLLERNSAAGSGFGFLLGGADNRLLDNTVHGANVGIEVLGSRQRLDGNQACNNLSGDLVTGLDPAHGAVTASGADNACRAAVSWSDQGRSGCTFTCDQIRLPSSGFVITGDTLFADGSFFLARGLLVTGRGVRVHLAGTELLGPQGGELPGIELRDAPGASLTGGTITGFGQGLLVQRSDGVQIDGLEIRGAAVGVDVASGARGQLANLRVAAGQLALRLGTATQGWTVDQSDLASEQQSGAVVAGSGHFLRHNRIAGGVTLSQTTGSHLIENTIASRREGIALLSSGPTEIRGNDVRGGEIGIHVRDGSAAQIAGNVVSGSRGILLEGGGGHQVAGNQVDAGVAPIHLSGSHDDRILDNILAGRRGPALLLERAQGNEIAGNDATASMAGFDLHSSDANRIHGNRCVPTHLLPGISLSQSNGNVVADNVLTDLWPGGALALASQGNQLAGNELRPSGAAPRQIVAQGIGLIERPHGPSRLPAGELARGLALAWESMGSWSGPERLNPRTGARFFQLLAAGLGVFQQLAAEPRALPEEQDLLGLATAQIARGAELAARRAIQDAQNAGADPALLAAARRGLRQGIAEAQSGRQSLAAAAFGSVWATVSADAFSPARLAAAMTVDGQFTEGGEIAYHVTLSNAGPRTQLDNPGDEFFDRLPATLQLVSVDASGGQARTDLGAGIAAWSGSLPPGGTVTLTIRAAIGAGTGGQTIANQGAVFFDADGDGVNSASAPTDDPTLPGPADATVFTVAALSPATAPGCVTAIAAGGYDSLAARNDRTALAWGDNEVGELGDGTTVDRSTPAAVKGLTGVIALAGGQFHTLALLDDGSVWAWGRNDLGGALGDGSLVNSALPVRVKGPGGVGTLTGVVAVAAGAYHSLALLGDGSVLAWGYNSMGELGNCTTTSSPVPLPVPGLSGARAIAAGGETSLALLADGTVRAWGRNAAGQLGNGTLTGATAPIIVLAPDGYGFLGGVKAVAAGGQHALALLGDGSVLAWGDNASGQLGNGTLASSRLPVPVSGAGGVGKLSNVAALASGSDHSLALLGDGTVVAWGHGLDGELGDGGSANSSVPVAVTALSGVTALAAGFSHSLALLGDGSVRAWGLGSSGQLGSGSAAGANVPVTTRALCPARRPPPA